MTGAFACDPCECGGSDDCRQCNPLTVRELAHHIVRNVDPWCDADAIRVAQAYLDLRAAAEATLYTYRFDTNHGLGPIEDALDDGVAAGPPDDPADT
jgi:hypothetical protein